MAGRATRKGRDQTPDPPGVSRTKLPRGRLLFLLAIGFVRPIQWEPLAGAICGASGFACLAVGVYL